MELVKIVRFSKVVPPVFGATVLGLPLRSHVEPTNLVMPYLVGVVLCAVFLGRGPAIVAALASVLAFDFFLVPPHHTFAVADTQYLLTFGGLFVVGLVVGTLAARSREQAETARCREQETADLFALSQELTGAHTRERIVQVLEEHVQRTLGVEAHVVLVEGGSGSQHPDDLYQSELAPRCGRQTCFLELRTGHELLGFLMLPALPPVSSAEVRVLKAYSTVATLALEREGLVMVANQVELLRATERLQASLLGSISHELRTPLASVVGALSGLRAGRRSEAALPQDAWEDLVDTAWEEAGDLNRRVSNLLEMTRLQAGALKVKFEPTDIEDLVGATLTQLDGRLGAREISVRLSANLPLVPLDFVLIVHVLSNMLDNALKFSSDSTAIEITAEQTADEMKISVGDRGIGIPADDLELVFDSFYRVAGRKGSGGTGLGLSICRGIVQAHGGRVWAENRSGGGSVVSIALPLRTSPIQSSASRHPIIVTGIQND